MSGCQRDDDHVSTTCPDFSRPDNGVGSVVTALDDHIRLQQSDELERCVLLEQRNGIHYFERGKHVHALGISSNGAVGSFEALYGCVAVHADNERVSACAGPNKDVHVTGVKQVEHAIREHDTTRLPRAPLNERRPRHRFSLRVERTQ
jgi:hypothetical protein